MSLSEFLAQYGYLAVFAGALLEGETVLLLAGFAAQQGYLSLPWVIVVALCGGVLGDQACFLLVRRYGRRLLERFPSLALGVQRVDRLLLRYHSGLIVGLRFLYGLRLIGPLAIGMSTVRTARFVAFNLIGAALWAPLVGGAGYLFGHTLVTLFADARHIEEIALLTLLAGAAALGLWHRHQRRQ